MPILQTAVRLHRAVCLKSPRLLHGITAAKRGAVSTRGDFASTSLSGQRRLDPSKRRRAFQIDCARIWGNQYDYAKAKYKDNHTPVQIMCPSHGAFWLRPRDHIQRRTGCPKCIGAHTSRPGNQDLSKSAEMPSLGQHLLRNRKIANEISRVALPDSHAQVSVAEIGVGAAALTVPMLARPACRRIIGFDIDASMVERAVRVVTSARLGPVVALQMSDFCSSASGCADVTMAKAVSEARCVLLHGDVLKSAALPTDCEVVVGNLPYRVSSSLIVKLLLHFPRLRRFVLMVQAEFARRLFAKPGSLKYGRLAILAALLCAKREYALPGRIPPEAFDPPPRVDSAVVLLEPRQEPLAHAGHVVSPAALDFILRIIFDNVNGDARGFPVEYALEKSSSVLPRGWATAVARSKIGGQPATALPPEAFAALAGELLAAAIACGEEWPCTV